MFTDPVAQVIITKPAGPSGPEKKWNWSAPEFPFLTSVSLNYEWERIPTITINIDAPYMDGVEKILTSPTPIGINNQIQARIGYAGGLFTPWAVGTLTQGGDGISVDAQGVSGSVSFQPIQDESHWTVSKDFPSADDTTLADVLLFVVEQMRLNLKLLGNAEGVLKAVKAAEWAGEKAASPWQILKRVCREFGLSWFIGADPKDPSAGTRSMFVFKSSEMDEHTKGEVRRSYIIRGVIDVSNNQYPCSGWTPEGGPGFAMWMNQKPDPAADGSTMKYVDDEDGTTRTAEADRKTLDVKAVGPLGGGKGGLPPVEQVPDPQRPEDEKPNYQVGDVKGGPDGQKDADAKMNARTQEGNPVQHGSITCPIGLPEETPGTICYLGGGGSVYNGNYFVQKLTQSYAVGSWEMTLGVFRHGIGGNTIDGDQVDAKDGEVQ